MLSFEQDQTGHDSEWFLWDKAKETVAPSYHFFPVREAAFERVNWKGNRLFRDGLAVEGNVSPDYCRAYLIERTKALFLQYGPMPDSVKQKCLGEGAPFTFTTRPWVPLTEEMMKDFPEDLRILGCSPTFDAYTESQKVIKVDPMKLMFRTSGSHLHMSFRQKRPVPVDFIISAPPTAAAEVPQEFWTSWTKLADLLVGVPFTYIFNDEDEFKRRKLYGQAGEFRFQTYNPTTVGLEYRVLSSRLWDHQAVTSLFMGLFKYGLYPTIVEKAKELWDKAWEDDIREAINEGGKEAMGRCFTYLDKILTSGQYGLGQFKPAVRYYTDFHTFTSADLKHICDKIRVAREKGIVRDARSILDTSWPEAHYGWGEYWINEFSKL